MQATKAEERARLLAGRLEEAGYTVKVTVHERPAELFSTGRVMSGKTTYVSVYAVGPNVLDDTYGFSFVTRERSEYARASTAFVAAHMYRATGKTRSRKMTLRQLRDRIATEVYLAVRRGEYAAGRATS